MLALARYQLGDDPGARKALASARWTQRSARAVELLLDGELKRAGLPAGDPGQPMEEHLLTTLALRLGGEALEEQRQELQLASQVDDSDPRVRLLHADWLAQQGSYVRSLQVLRGVEGSPRLRRLRRWRSSFSLALPLLEGICFSWT